MVDPNLLTHIHSHRDLISLSLSRESTCLEKRKKFNVSGREEGPPQEVVVLFGYIEG